jgi:hypothetical protein
MKLAFAKQRALNSTIFSWVRSSAAISSAAAADFAEPVHVGKRIVLPVWQQADVFKEGDNYLLGSRLYLDATHGLVAVIEERPAGFTVISVPSITAPPSGRRQVVALGCSA